VLLNKTINNDSSAENARAKSLNKYTNFVESQIKVGATRRIKDLTYIAQACKRAGKIRVSFSFFWRLRILFLIGFMLLFHLKLF